MSLPKQLQPRRPLSERLSLDDATGPEWSGAVTVPTDTPAQAYARALAAAPTLEGKLRLAAEYAEQGLLEPHEVLGALPAWRQVEPQMPWWRRVWRWLRRG